MPTASLLTLYTHERSVQPFGAFAQLLGLALGQPAQVRPLTELPPPDRPRAARQQLRRERGRLSEQLETVRYLLEVAEHQPHRYAWELQELRQDQARYEQRLQQLDAALRDAPS